MSDLLAYSGQGNNFATGTLDASGHLIWDPATPDFSQCDGLQIDESAQDPSTHLAIWFAVDRGSVNVKPNANGFPTFDITTPLAQLPQISLTFSGSQWHLSATISALNPGSPQFLSFDFAPDNTGPLPPSQKLSVQFVPNLVSTPAYMRVDVNSGQNAPWDVTVEFVAMANDASQWALRVSTRAVTLSGGFWQQFPTNQDLTLQFTYLPGITAISGQGPFSRAFLEITGFTSAVANYWNAKIAQPYLLSVLTAEPDAPISAIWSIQETADWSYCAYVSNFGLSQAGDSLIGWQPGCFSLASGTSLSFALPAFLVHTGGSFQGTATTSAVSLDQTLADQLMTLTSQLTTRVSNPNPIAFIVFRIANMTAGASQMARLGALDLTFSANTTTLQNDSWHVIGYLEPVVNRSLPQPIPPTPRIMVQDLELAITQVQVGSEDPLPVQPGESPLESALVIPLTQAGTGEYELVLLESNPFGSQRSMTLTINQNQGGSGSMSLLVLDRNPFQVARVSLPSLLGSATGSNALVAQWSNTYADGEGWHTQSGAQPFTVYLPSQGVGEQYERRNEDPHPIGINNPLDFRFSPAAQVQIAPPVLQGATDTYFEAPWNLRRLLSTPGQNVPGSRLRSFNAELLYGLPVNVSSSSLWIAEVAALTGRLAGPMSAPPAGVDISNDVADWSNANEAFNARLSAWMPWDGAQPNSLQLSDEAQFTLRSSADLAYPAFDAQPSGTAPYPSQLSGLQGGVGWIFESERLQGGVGWIFESESLYRSIWQQPASTSAQLIDPAFSALGGWARQRAVFLSGVATINSRVEMGRVSTISLEQIGRIGVLWNRAKLVIVYERTVQASDQFKDDQAPLLGRPIVRKVAEYVELLEPIRSYPESGSGNINAAFVQGSEFKSKVISVDSSWGSDLPNGTQVPLWNPAANPNVYPKPHILLQVAVDPNTGNATQSVEIDQPEKLVFYSNTATGADPNPDLWPAVQGIDFADVDTALKATPTGRSIANQQYRLSIVPGLGAFTWNLVPAAFATNVVAQRTTSPLSASLKNVSMMRYQPVTTPTASQYPSPVTQVSQVLDGAQSIFQEISDHLASSTVQEVIDSRNLDGYFSDLSTYVPSFTIPDFTGAGEALVSAGMALMQQAVSSAVQTVQAIYAQLSTASDDKVVALAQQLGQVLDTTFGSLNFVNLHTGFTDALTRLTDMTNHLTTVQQGIQASFGQPGQTLSLLKDLQQNVSQNISQNASSLLTKDLPPFESLLGDGFLPGWQQLASIEGRIAQPFIELQNGTPVEQLEDTITAALSSLSSDISDLNSTLTTIQNTNLIQQLPSTIDPGSSRLSAVQSVQDVKNWLASLPSDPDQMAAAITPQMQNFATKLTGWLGGSTNGVKNIASWLPASADAMRQSLFDASAGLQSVLQARSLLATGAFGPGDVTQLQNEFQTAVSTFLSTATSALGNDISSAAYNQASQVLNAVRAFGAPPIAPGLTFNLPEVDAPSLDQLAYFFDSTLSNVPITSNVKSLLASAAQALPQLMPVQLNVPVSALLDRLIPDPQQLAQTAISDLFKNIAGMDLSSLFSGLLPPLNAPDGINIRHSINPQTLTVTVEADIDVSFPNQITVLNEGPVLLQLNNARFQVTLQIDVSQGAQPVEQVSGQISGDWELQIASLSLVTFVSTSLSFDQTGHIRFNVSPEKVRLASVMQFIADLVNSLGSPGSGLSIVFSPSPIAVTSTLDLPLPDIAGGAFALSNVRLGALFQIGMDSSNKFQFLVGMNLSEEDAPFAIVIFILGGGGWVQAQMSYIVGSAPTVSLTIGISAIASLEIALGPISGGVSISFSLFAEYSSTSSLDLGIVIVVAGHVSLLGIVEADITLMLEADYDAGQLTGRGSVSVDIKICWCFTLSIHQEVEYQFGNQQSNNSSASNQQIGAQARVAQLQAAAAPDDYWNYASEYISTITA